jgi:antirestriction protein ArdC
MTTYQATRVRQARHPAAAAARDRMQEFANRIIAELENGVKPWVRPWDPEKADGPHAPFNPVTGKRYHGINVRILGMDNRNPLHLSHSLIHLEFFLCKPQR